MRGPGPAALLERALTASACAHFATVKFFTTRSTRWESATFSGARHVVHARGPANARLATWLTALPDLDLPLRGQLVADLRIVDQVRDDDDLCVTIEVLTVVVS